mmetsp:Transcript_29829/g.70948  ORF Transcript_29829/g.70948 Transcript_29829/m.70948 type:complete len:253 (-) Transcript_29829:275-1033(-)
MKAVSGTAGAMGGGCGVGASTTSDSARTRSWLTCRDPCACSSGEFSASSSRSSAAAFLRLRPWMGCTGGAEKSSSDPAASTAATRQSTADSGILAKPGCAARRDSGAAPSTHAKPRTMPLHHSRDRAALRIGAGTGGATASCSSEEESEVSPEERPARARSSVRIAAFWKVGESAAPRFVCCFHASSLASRLWRRAALTKRDALISPAAGASSTPGAVDFAMPLEPLNAGSSFASFESSTVVDAVGFGEEMA